MLFAQVMSDHQDWWGAGWWWLMAAGMLVFWIALVVGVVWILRSFLSKRHRTEQDSAEDILRRRLAEGAVSSEEYEERLEILRRSSRGSGHPD